MNLKQTLRAVLIVGGMLTTTGAVVNAQDTLEDVGIVRISDCAPGKMNAGPCGSGPCGNGQCGNGPCGNGMCGNGMCGNGYYGCRPCGYGHCGSGCYHKCHCTRHVHNLLSWLDPCGGCSLPPDAGWAPPGKVALWRKPVAYNKFFPDAWTGAPGVPAVEGLQRPGHVYMPTDTTQLGHYYQTVPKWHPARGMVPAAPNPNDWHQPLCTQNGAIVVGASAESVNCPAAAPAAAPAEAPVVAPEPAAAEAALPAAPPAPVADLSAAGETPALLPTPR